MQAENVHRRYRHTTIKLYSHEISRLHHSLGWNILVTLVYSTPDCGVTYTYTLNSPDILSVALKAVGIRQLKKILCHY